MEHLLIKMRLSIVLHSLFELLVLFMYNQQMDGKSMITVLNGLQWTDEEATMYVTLLELGRQPASVVANHLNRNRVTVFHALERMAKKGLVRKIPHRSGAQFSATEPGTLLQRMEEEREKRATEAQFRVKTLASIVPELEAIRAMDVVRPRVQLFHGEEALKDIYALSLQGTDMCAYFAPWSPSTDKHLRDIDDWHTGERAARKIPVRIITPDTDEGRAFASVSAPLKEIRLVPTNLFPHQDITLVTDRHLLIFSLADRLGIAVESTYIAANQRAIFTLAWQGAKVYFA